ncbi:hypothetical protein P3S68_003293 [Capsicum galapagoense]
MASSAMTHTNVTTDQLALLSLKSQIISTPLTYWIKTGLRLRPFVIGLELLLDSWEFGNLTFLVSLDSEINNFQGNLPQEMARLHRLKFLRLSVSNFSRKTLNMNFNSIEGQIPEVIGSLINLRELNLRGNKIIGSIPLSLSNDSRLEILDLSHNSFQGNFPEGIGNLHNMNLLVIQYNQLTCSIPFTIFNISRIEVIAFTGNSLSGSLPNGLCNGLPILKGEIGRLSYLETLDLGTNHFTGMFHLITSDLFYHTLIAGIIPQEIGNLVNLVDVDMEDNQITASVSISIFNISSQKILSAWQKNLSGFLQWEIGNLTKVGEIPKEISNLVELEVLTLDFNSFSGSHDMEIFNISGLRIIDLTVNNLSGSLPPNIGSILPNIEELYLACCDSLLSFLTSITNCKNLSVLSLSFNPLNGMLPASVGNLSTSLLKFHAKSCKIKGRIANEIGNFSSLLFLDISENNLVGLIPTTIGNLRNLQRFNLSNNKLTGFIGDHICKLQHLGEIYLGQNKLSGSLPNCLGNITSLREIHLGSNKVSSNISPNLGNLQDLLVLDVSSNNMVGSLPPEIGNLKVVTKMDLLMNQFSHGIPKEIGELQNSLYLSLRHNKLQGSIPDSESNMVGLEFLDLSHNNISGTIPKTLEKLQNLKYFNVSINKFYGEIPSGGPFKNLSSLFLIDNEALCGSSRFTTDDLSESNLIGSGSIDSVYKGILKSGTAIVVKLFNLQVDAAFKSFDMECEVLRSFRHRNLVKVITSCSNLDFKALVLEYMPNRCLDKYLYSHNYLLDIKQILSIMIDVACALEYLHHGCLSLVIHCDLKPSNVLLDEDLVAHPSNFGISKLLGEDQSDLYTKTLATLGYIAPVWTGRTSVNKV